MASKHLQYIIDDDEDTSAFSSLDSEGFSRAESPEATSSTTASPYKLPLRKKRGIVATSTWDYAREPSSDEPARSQDNRHRLWYCSLCKKPRLTNLSSARYHLSKEHHITVEANTSKAQKRQHERLEDIFIKVTRGYSED
ncbi:hypothetical protein V1517DRAFT_349684 [Lipomyces orientalis]|uniref:Uncharacterized protein n=1 Tax=Lipomyces orientalis TaxID=1233043 RepID=A0ACC3TDD4_9ASCO